MSWPYSITIICALKECLWTGLRVEACVGQASATHWHRSWGEVYKVILHSTVWGGAHRADCLQHRHVALFIHDWHTDRLCFWLQQLNLSRASSFVRSLSFYHHHHTTAIATTTVLHWSWSHLWRFLPSQGQQSKDVSDCESNIVVTLITYPSQGVAASAPND